MNWIRMSLAAAAVASLAGCERSGVVVGNEGVGARTEAGNVRAAVGPDDAAVGVSGDRVVAGVGNGRAAAGVRVDEGGPLVVGGGRPRGGGLFGGLGMGF